MKARGAIRLACAAALAASVMTVIPASAQVVSPDSLERAVIRRDGNDTRSPLDLRRVTVVHSGVFSDSIYLVAWNAITNLQLEPQHHGNLGVFIDTNNKPRRFEYAVYLFSRGSRLVGQVYHPGRGTLTAVSVRRLGARSFVINLPLRLLSYPNSYRFAAFGYYMARPCSGAHPCTDYVPNTYPLPVQDLAAPTVSSVKGTSISSTVLGTGLTVPLPFTVHDDRHGSGIRGWTVQSRPVGDTEWSTIVSGTSGSGAIDLTGDEGDSFEVSILAHDRAGNVTELDRTVWFPFDDQNGTVVAYTGVWSHASGSSTSFLGTTSESSTTGDTATFSFDGGSAVCALGMPTTGAETATVLVDGRFVLFNQLDEDPATAPRKLLRCYALFADPHHTLTVTVGAAPDGFILDGFAVIP
jgi:hypothetical protein